MEPSFPQITGTALGLMFSRTNAKNRHLACSDVGQSLFACVKVIRIGNTTPTGDNHSVASK